MAAVMAGVGRSGLASSRLPSATLNGSTRHSRATRSGSARATRNGNFIGVHMRDRQTLLQAESFVESALR